MSRAAVYDAILANSELITLGFDKTSVLINYDGEQRPSDELFLVLHWDNDEEGLRGDDGLMVRNFRPLTIWVHMYKEFSSDFVRIDDILDILDRVLTSMVHVAGADGRTVTLIEPVEGSRSRDMRDDTYETLCRSTSYRILSRETATV